MSCDSDDVGVFGVCLLAFALLPKTLRNEWTSLRVRV